MRRREFITVLGGAVAWPVAVRAQRAGMRRIGVFTNLAADDPESQARIGAFLQGLQQSGWIIGSNVRIEYRWGTTDYARYHQYAAELVALSPDVILCVAGAALTSLQQATRTIPTLFVGAIDPVGAGQVASWRGQAAMPRLRLVRIRPKRKMAGAAQTARPWGDARGGTARFGHRRRNRPGCRDPIGGAVIEYDIERARRARRRGDRAHGYFICGRTQWRPDRAAVRVSDQSSRSDRHVGGAASIARRLFLPAVHHRWRPRFLRARLGRPVPTRGRLRRSHSQGRDASRPASAGADQI